MEQRANKKIASYMNTFKEELLKESYLNKDSLKKIFDKFPNLEFMKDDFIKRKRVKNFVPKFDRCIAKRANGEQCTRRKKDECSFCGTHKKGRPHGIITNMDTMDNYVETKIEINTQDIGGIIYYIDKFNNVYDPQDILNGKPNPQIISKYEITNDIYFIIDTN